MEVPKMNWVIYNRGSIMLNESFKGHNYSDKESSSKEMMRDDGSKLETNRDETYSIRAIEIAGVGNYVKIIDSLRRENLLNEEKNRVGYTYALDKITFLTEKDKEMFTILDLYDIETARHCIETYRIARNKMEVEVLPGMTLEYFLQKEEGISLEQFYRACLFHDIGKVEVPRQVIQHEMGDSAMLGCLHRIYHDLYINKKIPKSLGLKENPTDTALAEALEIHRIRPIYLVPAREILSEKEITDLEHLGFSGDETLMEMIMKHEQKSGDILKEAGLPVEAYLAAHHHNYNREPLQYPTTVDALHISVDLADILHMADVTEAVSSLGRKYRKAFSIPKTMRTIIEHVEDGKISPFTAYLWLTDDLRRYENKLKVLSGTPNDEDRKDLAFVRTFLENGKRIRPGKSKQPLL